MIVDVTGWYLGTPDTSSLPPPAEPVDGHHPCGARRRAERRHDQHGDRRTAPTSTPSSTAVVPCSTAATASSVGPITTSSSPTAPAPAARVATSTACDRRDVHDHRRGRPQVHLPRHQQGDHQPDPERAVKLAVAGRPGHRHARGVPPAALDAPADPDHRPPDRRLKTDSTGAAAQRPSTSTTSPRPRHRWRRRSVGGRRSRSAPADRAPRRAARSTRAAR